MADALYSPYLQGYCFLVVGNTDAVGTREYNFKLSQQRADAIRDALINPFAIKPARIEAVGLGEENLINPANPKATENRRVQLINLGKLGANATCPNRPEQILRYRIMMSAWVISGHLQCTSPCPLYPRKPTFAGCWCKLAPAKLL